MTDILKLKKMSKNGFRQLVQIKNNNSLRSFTK